MYRILKIEQQEVGKRYTAIRPDFDSPVKAVTALSHLQREDANSEYKIIFV